MFVLCLKQWGFLLGWTSGTAVMITVVRNSKIEKLSPSQTRQLKPLHRSWLDLLQSRPFSKSAHLLNKTWSGKALTGYFVLSLFPFPFPFFSLATICKHFHVPAVCLLIATSFQYYLHTTHKLAGVLLFFFPPKMLQVEAMSGTVLSLLCVPFLKCKVNTSKTNFHFI